MATTKVEGTTDAEEKPKEFVRPPFDPVGDIKKGITHMLFNPDATLILLPILLLGESMALKFITKQIPYTEIDYEAYMEQIDMIVKDKNLNYAEIRGGTGPLVYPAGHVWIYRFMYWVTNGMEDLAMGQQFFRYLYIGTLFFQLLTYYELQIQPWCVVLACLSKRLHSIFILRLFNDCFETFFMVSSIYFFVKACKSKRRTPWVTLASVAYTFAVSVKMNGLLFLPGVLVAIYLLTDGNLITSMTYVLGMAAWQIVVATPFLLHFPREYISGAFNFERQFFHHWSINWQFISEDVFLGQLFQRGLLITHIVLLVILILFKHVEIIPDGIKSLVQPRTSVHKLSSTELVNTVPFILIMSNFIGIICARSLHYQFLSWYHWTIPILIHWSKLPFFIGPIWYVCHEWCWNSYPPNDTASVLLFFCNTSLLSIILLVENFKFYLDTALEEKKMQ
ncbi:dolichyl-P-Man:Man(5)GlcNAc(2)-PP-dolichol alpha-1,3-mannosyltransferase KNAG_0B02260 [Huiozyma naganishii CBS 8797]|uniref:Dol-P-Man:Man(5)GlcNAc(2)-PP-Dol alpha-1,3-mannosyltransferase n=1 Tax=Huiozyma naganishii (strain ATCC MYA-139 / BCRC 22969 / CBS 8797 / KCTC 17520 / NBRC 10181 / NCYC 3082 / Yp74L-3) TaxID=1071383 RepID=J7RGJ6_HUIN7|nr:hypothetical protein KNAG_0B02260 [Kazachstania naganishii CBS 8797]CCK68668.1 hypothetical protein KNAG_0B02260 [Kazachstania naganishii CBS 8797]